MKAWAVFYVKGQGQPLQLASNEVLIDDDTVAVTQYEIFVDWPSAENARLSWKKAVPSVVFLVEPIELPITVTQQQADTKEDTKSVRRRKQQQIQS